MDSDLIVRALVLIVVALGVVLAAALYRRRADRDAALGPETMPRVPRSLVARGARTWLLFTTPYCASCGPVEAELRAHDPGAALHRIDATVEADLAQLLRVSRAPTAVLADPDGTIRERLVGASAVRTYTRG